MATYYIRTTGNNSNAGTSPSTAWLTFGKALGATGISSGDTVYVGGGTYRETVAVAMTSATAETKIIGDTYGTYTGDPGEVVLSAYTTNDTTAPSSTILFNLQGRDYLTFENIKFIGGGAVIFSATTSVSTNITLTQCAFVCGLNGGTGIITHTTAANTASNWTIDQCIFFKGSANSLLFTLTRPATADFDYNIIIKNCFFIGTGRSIVVGSTGANSFNGGGVLAYNCTNLGGDFLFASVATLSTSIPCKAYNNYIYSGSVGFQANTLGQITEDYNLLVCGATPRTNVTAGANSTSDGSRAPLFFTGLELITRNIRRPIGMPVTGSPLLGYGNQAGGPSVDILGTARPAGTESVGAYESKDFNQTVIY